MNCDSAILRYLIGDLRLLSKRRDETDQTLKNRLLPASNTRVELVNTSVQSDSHNSGALLNTVTMREEPVISNRLEDRCYQAISVVRFANEVATSFLSFTSRSLLGGVSHGKCEAP